MSNTNFVELGSGSISEDRDIIISKNTADEDTIMLAQKAYAKIDGHAKPMFLKGAIKTDKKGLINFRDALIDAVKQLEKLEENN